MSLRRSWDNTFSMMVCWAIISNPFKKLAINDYGPCSACTRSTGYFYNATHWNNRCIFNAFHKSHLFSLLKLFLNKNFNFYCLCWCSQSRLYFFFFFFLNNKMFLIFLVFIVSFKVNWTMWSIILFILQVSH
jgi:hypothetical protein